MNIEYIGLENAVLDQYFINGKQLTSNFSSKLKEEGFIQKFGTPSSYQGSRFYEDFNLDSNGDYKATLVSVHEDGIVIEFRCIINAGSAKYNTATSALLIIKDGEIPKFVVNAIDGRLNSDFRPEGDNSFWVDVNQEIIEKLISELGKRVDEKMIGQIPKDNILTRKLHERNVELASIYVTNRLEHASHVLSALEETIEYSRTK